MSLLGLTFFDLAGVRRHLHGEAGAGCTCCCMVLWALSVQGWVSTELLPLLCRGRAYGIWCGCTAAADFW